MNRINKINRINRSNRLNNFNKMIINLWIIMNNLNFKYKKI